MSEKTITIPVKFAKFLKAVMEASREDGGGDLEGGWLQDYATETGILVATPVSEPCGEGENCVCADYGFPTECYRYSPDFKAMLTAIKS